MHLVIIIINDLFKSLYLTKLLTFYMLTDSVKIQLYTASGAVTCKFGQRQNNEWR
jgi:hypothetical protein